MLAATHADALAFLHQLGQPWREDPTNADRSRTRARLRHDVLPILRDLRPTVARQALRLTDHVRDAVERLDERLKRDPSAPSPPIKQPRPGAIDVTFLQ